MCFVDDFFWFHPCHFLGFKDSERHQKNHSIPCVLGSKLLVLGMVIQPLIGNPYNGYINPYYWVDDHPLLYGNNGSLDPGTCDFLWEPHLDGTHALSTHQVVQRWYESSHCQSSMLNIGNSSTKNCLQEAPFLKLTSKTLKFGGWETILSFWVSMLFFQ